MLLLNNEVTAWEDIVWPEGLKINKQKDKKFNKQKESGKNERYLKSKQKWPLNTNRFSI